MRRRGVVAALHVAASSQVDALDGLPARRTAKAPFSAMAPAMGQVQAKTSAQPAGRPVTATTCRPAAVARAMRVVGGGHERAVVRERVVDVAEDAAQRGASDASSR